MENLILKGTDTLPSVSLDINGEIKLEGRALPENAAKFFQPLNTWASEFNAKEVNITINLEYFNTSVSKHLYDFLKIFDENPANKKINLIWMYEEGDDEMQESGEIYQDLLTRTNFGFKQYAEVFNK
jgi:hypothetical protein